MKIETLKSYAAADAKTFLIKINKVSGWKKVIIKNRKGYNIRGYMNTWYDLDNNEKIIYVVWKGLNLPFQSFLGPIK
ncbi:hypothetical protein [Acetobacter persici]|uniref:hypothetical protein n=1 Tax=Acetobacter persici TaxID=1076596 RepID=UPI001BA71132|nr:hypothetical protein [Acetobacter persici]MBS1016475.1 hypothetical protein [Acetobacter persici]